MGFNYTGLQNVGVSMIAKFGQNVTFEPRNSSTYNPDTGTVMGGAFTSQALKAAIFDATERQVDGAAIQRGDKFLFIDGTQTSPSLKDKVLVGGTTYYVQNVETVSPGGTDCLYKVQVRR